MKNKPLGCILLIAAIAVSLVLNYFMWISYSMIQIACDLPKLSFFAFCAITYVLAIIAVISMIANAKGNESEGYQPSKNENPFPPGSIKYNQNDK